MPPLEDFESVVGLTSRHATVWLLTTRGDSGSPRIFASEDAGVTWDAGTSVTPADAPKFAPTGILADNDRLYLAGSCAPRGGEGHACLVVGDGTAWAVETPFGVAGPATSMLPPARGDDGSLLVAVTMPAFSEGWLAQRRQGGQWIGSRGDVVGDEPGDVVALGAGSRGKGLVAVTTSTATTSLVTRARADADAGADRRNVLGGPGVSSWVRPVGVGLSPSSQFLEVRPTVVKAATGGYLVLKKDRPVTMTDTSLEPEEWRPAQLRGMDAFLGESAGGVSVLVGSDPAKTLEDLGEVRVFATNPDGTWDRVATDLTARFKGQMAMAMTHTGGMWLVATSSPILSIAKDAARLFGSEDGRTWVELPAPEAAGSANRISALCGSNGDMVLALGTEAGPAKDGGWVRSAGTWHDLVVPAGLSPQRCAGTPVAVVVIGGDDGADRIWRLEGQGLVEVDADLPPRADLRDVVPIGGGVGVVGFVESRGVRAVSVWFSRDMERWSQTRLDAVAGDAYVTAAASGDELVVVATSSDGVRAWRVRKPW